MNEKQPIQLPPPNPQTRLTHRREVFWQITFPALVGSLIVVGLGVAITLAAFGMPPATSVSRWADTAMIWLVLPLLFFALLLLVLLAGILYGVIKLIGVLPPYARIVQNFFWMVEARIKTAADRVVKPVMSAHQVQAGLKEIQTQFSSIKRSRGG